MSFENLPQAIQPTLAPPLPGEVAFSDEALDDATALNIVLQDVSEAEKYLTSKNISQNLEIADDMIRAYVKPRQWPNGKQRANIGMPIILEAVEKLITTLHLALFGSGKEPFDLKPTGRTTPQAARAKSKVLKWAIKAADLKENIRLSLKTCLSYGFVAGNWGWEEKEKTIKEYVYEEGTKDKVKAVKSTVYINQPTYEVCDLRQFLWDPGCKVQNLRKGAKWVAKQTFVDANWLDDNRDNPMYKNIPTRDELVVRLAMGTEPTTDSMRALKTNNWRDMQAEQPDKATSFDPLKHPLEIIEYWTQTGVVAVLQRCIIIRNEESEFTSLPFPSCAFIDVLNSAVGFGVAKLLGGEQRFQTAVFNSWIDSLALIMNPAFQIEKGMGAGTQQINVSPGKVVNEGAKLTPLVTPSISTEAMNAIESSELRANRRVSANSGSNMPTQAMRTAEGIQSFQSNVTERLQYFLDIFCDMVFIPVLEAFLEMCSDKLTPAQIKTILTEAEGKDYEGDILEVYNATCEVEVLAGTKLAARQAAAQLIPMLVNLVTMQPVQDSLQVQGKKFDYAELIDEALELNMWDINSLIVDMTPEDQKRADAQNAAMAKGMADAQLQAQKHKDEQENIDQKGVVQAGVAIVRDAAKTHMSVAQDELTRMAEGVSGN
jgi:hypothetical protein